MRPVLTRLWAYCADEDVWPVALIVCLSHWCFSIIIQIENFLLYFYSVVVPGSNQASLYAKLFFVSLPFFQFEHLAVALGCGLVGGGLWRWTVGRWGFLLFFTGLNTYLVLNQIGYRLFFTHLHLSAAGGPIRLSGLEALAGSALAEVDWLTLLNIPLMLGATVVCGCAPPALAGASVLCRPGARPPPPAAGGRRVGLSRQSVSDYGLRAHTDPPSS